MDGSICSKKDYREMAKTALELTTEELPAYRPGRRQEEQQMVERWERAWGIARTAADVLHEKFGATRVVVFGSLSHRAWFTPWSDIDLAAWGIPAGDFYRAVATITGLSSEFEIDLLDPETCRPALWRRIEREGIEL